MTKLVNEIIEKYLVEMEVTYEREGQDDPAKHCSKV